MTDILSERTEQNVEIAVFASLILLGVYFTAQFYWNVLGFIEVWASDEFVDMFKALFNLTALLLIGAVFVHQLRRLRERRDEPGDGVEGEKESVEESVEESEDSRGTESVESVEEEENEAVGSGEDKEDENEVPWKQYGDVEREDRG